MAPGSENAMVTGQGFVRAFKGPLRLSTLAGSRVFFNTDTSFAGLGSATTPGAITSSEVGDGGNSYAVGDTGTIDAGNGLASYEVLTVDGSGAVLTYDLIGPGAGYEVSTNIETIAQGAQPGVGVGFKINILSVAGGGKGSVFKVQDLLCYIGNGQVAFDGVHLAGITASPTLSLVKKSGGVYAVGPLTGPFQAGHSQPDPPVIFAKTPPSAGQVSMNAAVSVVIWRISGITGQVSLMSEPSNVLTVANGSVIVTIPDLPDTNGQDFWGIGVVKIGFADLGWYYQLPTSRNGEVAEAALTTIDGHDRAVEISWTNGHLLGQDTAPDKAFPPSTGDFAGAMNDVAWLDDDGIIYVSEPNFIGSFPPSNALFASEPAVTYLKINDGLTARLGKTTIGTLYYVGGSPALEYQTIIENQGIEFPQNACVGSNGRLLAWLGKPTVVDNSAEPDFGYAKGVLPEFEGWESQTAEQPIVVGYDGIGKYECWMWRRKIMAKFVPDDSWSSPINLVEGEGANEVIGDVIAAVTVRNKLYICCSSGSELAIYQFDAGTGSVMKIQTSDVSRMGFFSTVSMVMVEGRADNIDNPVRVEIVRNYDDANPIPDPLSDYVATPLGVGTQNFCARQPNVLDCNQHAVLVTIVSQGGDAGVNKITTMGANWDLLNHQCAAGTSGQVINFAPIEDQFVDAADFLIAATASSGLVVSFVPTGKILTHALGQSGDGYQVGDTGTIETGNGLATYEVLTVDGSGGVLTYELTAVGADYDVGDFTATTTSGAGVGFTVNILSVSGGKCSIVDHGDGTATVHMRGTQGECEITAQQAGNAVYDPAPDVTQVFNALKHDQEITFAAIADRETDDDDFNIEATASSGLTCSFVLLSGPAMLDDNGDGTATVHLTGDEGTCVIKASQAGDDTYNAAPDVERTFTVFAAPPVNLPTCGYDPPVITIAGSALRFTGNGTEIALFVSEEQINLAGEGGFIEIRIVDRGTGNSDPGTLLWNTGNDVQIGLLAHSDWETSPCVLSQFFAWSFDDGGSAQAAIQPNFGADPYAKDDTALFKVEIQNGDTTVRFYKNGVLLVTDAVNEPVHLVVIIGSSGSVDLEDSSFSFQPVGP